MEEQYYDGILNVKTCENQKGFSHFVHYHRYEPTPYSALEKLFEQYEIARGDHLVDFGCGKGRLNFYVHHVFKASVLGIEMNVNFYKEAMENRIRYLRKFKRQGENIQFQCLTAEQYQIKSVDNKFYFFNPFSIQIFIQVINNIFLSVEQSAREVDLILYYPSSDYIYYLENKTPFEMIREVRLPEMYEQNPNERFLIYRFHY
ncbi:class I SAM-dependent methyltransferase [Bacillus sp. MRMR6]|uniref:class I SAM-dependent methyltransferase n=1 Tax=Bacillus sp. MRMR6 TaxID=1928617 RepID=UPI0009520F4B|nr:class I SAM-dependent methyltransferase [Bacillus sp. MRMR6]OLS36780.1 SAM-dependent methyltransferase [Bacillus sp. MRMR6]